MLRDRRGVTNIYRVPTLCQILCWARGRPGSIQQPGAAFAKESSWPMKVLENISAGNPQSWDVTHGISLPYSMCNRHC